MWIRLRSVQYVEQSGKQKKFNPGDWIDIGRQQALLWISRGDADAPTQGDLGVFGSSAAGELGVVITGLKDSEAVGVFAPYKDRLSVSTGEARLSCARTLLWDGACKLRRELLFVGFSLLDAWQIACPLFSYDVLASQVGSAAEREQTRAIIRDLRVPLYDTRLMFIKRCEETEELLRVWRSEWAEGNDPKLAFLRAFYKVKPLMLALPITWIDSHAKV